jgi:hypothetical protein
MNARWQPPVSAGAAGAHAMSTSTGSMQPPAWSSGTSLNLPDDKPLDPYLRWAVATQWRGFVHWRDWLQLAATLTDVERTPVRVLFERQQTKPQGKASRTAGPTATGSGLAPPPHYVDGPGREAPFATATLVAADLQTLAESGLQWKLALPLRDANANRLWSSKGLFGPDRDAARMSAKNVAAPMLRQVKGLHDPVAPCEEGALALIDFACSFLHPAFERLDSSRRLVVGTRVHAIWDQGGGLPPGEGTPGVSAEDLAGCKPNAWPWHAQAEFGYGREMGPKALNALAAWAAQPGQPDERTIYRGIDHLIDYADARRRIWLATHGGHLMDVLAGWPDPLAPGAIDKPDRAGQAPILFVQLPTLTAADSAGGSLAASLLDGVRYAMSRVPVDKPLVVSISYGNSAGPHDGSSLLERALEQLLKERPKNFAIVVAVGNAREARHHARRTVRGDRSALLRLNLAEGDTTDTFVELWYTLTGKGAALQARVRGPGGAWSSWLSAGGQLSMLDEGRSAETVALLRHDRAVPNGKRRLVFLALAPSERPAGLDGATVSPGEWQIEVRLAPGAPDLASQVAEIDAWIERDDPVPNWPGESTYFLDQTEDDRLNTISSLATARGVIRAGGFNLETGRPPAYSSLPAEAKPALFVLAACEESEQEPSVRAAATRAGEVYRMNGTSVAAPVLARALYNRMSDPKRQQPVGRDEWQAVLDDLVKHEGSRIRRFAPR